MKMFSINCDFGGQTMPFSIYIGQPEGNHHPAKFQADWLSSEKQAMIPAGVMEALSKLKEIADKNSVLLEDLCVYALGTEQQEDLNSVSTQEQQSVAEEQKTQEDQSEEDNDQDPIVI